MAWTVLTITGLVVVGYAWPYPSWSWGLLLGSGVGAAAVMIVAYAASHTDFWMVNGDG